MSNFIDLLKKNKDFSFDRIREVAISLLKPFEQWQIDDWFEELNRGKNILQDENHLNVYLKSFGNMHKAKLFEAFGYCRELENIVSKGIEIYDWGCGQGIATICLLDYLRTNYIKNYDIQKITLIEPSQVALKRAESIIKCINENISISCINKKFDNLTKTDFDADEKLVKIHLLSNILDVDTFNLRKLTKLITNVFSGNNYFFCVGPYYNNSNRLDNFIDNIAPKHDDIFEKINKAKGEWKENWTISLCVFKKYIEAKKSFIEKIEDLFVKRPDNEPTIKPEIIYFKANKDKLRRNTAEYVCISWKTTYCKNVSIIENGTKIENKEIDIGNGSICVYPDTTTRYVLSAVGNDDKIYSKEITINVFDVAEIKYFKVDKEYVIEGVPFVISWSVENSIDIRLNGKKVSSCDNLKVENGIKKETTYELVVTDEFETYSPKKLIVKMLPIPLYSVVTIPKPTINLSLSCDINIPINFENKLEEFELPTTDLSVVLKNVTDEFSSFIDISSSVPTLPIFDIPDSRFNLLSKLYSNETETIKNYMTEILEKKQNEK